MTLPGDRRWGLLIERVFEYSRQQVFDRSTLLPLLCYGFHLLVTIFAARFVHHSSIMQLCKASRIHIFQVIGKPILPFYASRIIKTRVINLQLDITPFEFILDSLFRFQFHLILLQPNRAATSVLSPYASDLA